MQKKAKEKLNQCHRDLQGILEQHPIASRLTISIGDKKYRFKDFIFEECKSFTNIESVLKDLTEVFEEHETESVLSRLDNIKYLFENHE